MTIDERLEKLTERHEAMAQTVELLTIDVRVLESIVRQVVGGISDLATIVRSHERRLSDFDQN